MFNYWPCRFTVSLKEDTTMLWRPSNVQLKNVKHKNVASYFEARQVLASEAVDQAMVDVSHGSHPTWF